MNPLPERLPPLPDPNSSMWIDEAIWGHRLYDEQSPWLVYMEFLNIFVHEDAANRAFSEFKGNNTLSYFPCKRLYLRNILFNNPKIERIVQSYEHDSDRWKFWLQDIQESSQGINHPKDFEYLKKHFNTFEDFYQIVSILRSTSLEIQSNKRWTSKFVFPYGKDCLYEDLDKKARTNDRRFFGRTGEILYLMLCRCDCKEELLKVFKNKIFQQNHWNQIVRCLQPGKKEDTTERANAFLPYLDHPCFNALAKDWISILKLNMPGYDMIPHLVNLAGFHLIKYQLDVSQQLMAKENPFPLVCEVIAPNKTLVREISCASYQDNNLLSTKAISYYISDIQKSKKWQQAIIEPDSFINCINLLKKEVSWPQNPKDYNGPNDPGKLIEHLHSAALKRHKQHVANIHRVYGREIGLISKRGTVRLRYAPNDEFLKTLIFINVSKRMELNLFMNILAERYGLIFGDKQAEKVLASDDFDQKAFQANSRRLEQRLVSLGLLIRLSDGCAYVINPYYTRQ